MKTFHAAALALLAVACARQRPDPSGSVAFAVEAAAAGGTITSVTVDVQPAGTTVSLAYDPASGKFKGTVEVPSGQQTFTVRAYSGPTLVATGNTEAIIAAGQITNVSITLLDPASPPPQLAPYVITLVTPASVVAGASGAFAATALDPQGGDVAYEWSQSCTTTAGIFGAPTSATTAWTAPGAPTSCQVTVKATSSASGLTGTKTATVLVVGTATGGADVTVDFAQPVIDRVWLQTFSAQVQEICAISRDDATANCPDPVPAGTHWTVAFTFTAATYATLTDDCGGSARLDPALAIPGGIAFEWIAPTSAGVCVLSAKASVGGASDTFPIAVAVVEAVPGPGYTVSGTFRSYTGSPAAGVMVAIYHNRQGPYDPQPEFSAETTTGADGSYAFTGIQPGNYTICTTAVYEPFAYYNRTVVSDLSGLDFTAPNPGSWSLAIPASTGPDEGLGNMYAVWGASADDVWAAGNNGHTLHWDGASWTEAPNPLSAQEADVLDGTWWILALWGAASDDVWAVGNWVPMHWDGTSWMALGSTFDLYAIWGSSSTDVWAVGAYAVTEHWNGSTWTSVPNPLTGSTVGCSLFGVWGSGPNDVWAVGTCNGTVATDYIASGVILHWDGSSWATATSGAEHPLNAVSGLGPNDAWALSYGVLHWDGTGWTAAASPYDASCTYVVEFYDGPHTYTWAPHSIQYGVWGTGPSDVWVFGQSMGIPPCQPAAWGDAQPSNMTHWDGSAWSFVPNPWSSTKAVFGMWGSGPNDVWAVGEFGVARFQQ